MSGLFDWLFSAPQSVSGVLGESPSASIRQPGFNKLGLFGAGLSDLGANLRGEPATHVANWQQSQLALGNARQQAQARKAMADAFLSGDPAAIQRATAMGIASGTVAPSQDSRFISANGSIYRIGPFDQQATPISFAPAPDPSVDSSSYGKSTSQPVQSGSTSYPPTMTGPMGKSGSYAVPMMRVPDASAPMRYKYNSDGSPVP